MKWIAAVTASVAVLASAASLRATASPSETWNDIRNVALVGGDYGSYLASSYCLDGCRYDRSSIDPGKGGQRFIRIEPTPDGDQAVIFEQPGAGAVTRIWMTTGEGVSQPLPSNVRIHIYFDGAATPTIDEPLDRFFAAQTRTARFMAPLESDRLASSGGNVSYLPLPYRNGIKIALLNGADLRLWYQLNYTQVADASSVVTYTTPTAFNDLRWLLGRPFFEDWLTVMHWPITRGRTANLRLAPYDAVVGTVTAAQPLSLMRRDGAGWIASTQIQLDRSRWHDVSIAFMFDGETTVDMPLDEFFAADALDAGNPRGLFNGVDANDAFYSTIPMPFRSSAEVTLKLRDGADPSPLTVRSVFKIDPTMPPVNAGIFHTQVRASCPTTPAQTGDQVILEDQGAGRMIGLALWMTTDGVQSGGYYMEGDERLYIDGSIQPLWYGTGVEDMFNGGFYFDQGEYIAPLSGATLRHPGTTDDATSMYRWFLTDAPTWRKSIVFKLENGPVGTDPLCLRSVAYYFAQPTPAQNVIASLDVGDASSVTAAHYQPSFDAQCAPQTARFGDEPPTERTATVCTGHDSSRFAFPAPHSGRFFRLRRTFDAGVAGQAAELWVNGAKIGAWSDVQANPTRRWSQLDVDFELAQPASELSFEIRPLTGRTMTDSAYQLWSSVITSPSLTALFNRHQVRLHAVASATALNGRARALRPDGHWSSNTRE